jgi:transaldolase
MIFRAAVNPITRKTRKSSRNKPARNLAIAIEAPAIVVKASSGWSGVEALYDLQAAGCTLTRF